MPTTLKSYAKINLGLRIGALRDDGFHALATVYQTIDLWDRITVTAEPAAETEITIRCSHSWVPNDQRNTCWKITAAALETIATNARVEIEIDKRLPVQGGLGAGSGNAAAALRALEAEMGNFPGTKPLSAEQRLAVAAQTGSERPSARAAAKSSRHSRMQHRSGVSSRCRESAFRRRWPFVSGIRQSAKC